MHISRYISRHNPQKIGSTCYRILTMIIAKYWKQKLFLTFSLCSPINVLNIYIYISFNFTARMCIFGFCFVFSETPQNIAKIIWLIQKCFSLLFLMTQGTPEVGTNYILRTGCIQSLPSSQWIRWASQLNKDSGAQSYRPYSSCSLSTRASLITDELHNIRWTWTCF